MKRPVYTIEELREVLKRKDLSPQERKRYQNRIYRRSPKERERRKKALKEWKLKNPEKVKEGVKRWKSENKDRILLTTKRWSSENKEKVSLSWRNYRIKNKHKFREWRRRRRGLEKRAIAESKTADMILEWDLSWRGRNIICPYCLKDTSPESTHVDHFFSLSKGGSHEIYNLVACCADCNAHKSDKDPFEWIREVASA